MCKYLKKPMHHLQYRLQTKKKSGKIQCEKENNNNKDVLLCEF